MKTNRKIKTGDTVQIIAGKDKGKIGKILQVFVERDRVVVEGANCMKKHNKALQKNLELLSNMKRMHEVYKTEIAPALVTELGVKNVNAVPKIVKIVVSVGVGKLSKDSKMLEAVESTLTRITGQKPAQTKSRVSISNFKLREGQVVGYKVTLRGVRMWDFLQKLVHVTFPRVRDFRGISPKLIDANGNMSIGFKDQLPFPEIRNDELDNVHGLEVTIHSTAGNKKNGQALFRAFGFPFKEGVK